MNVIYFVLTFNFLDVKNVTHPVQTTKLIQDLYILDGEINRKYVYLSPVELKDNQDSFGLMDDSDVETQRFLQFDYGE